MDERIVTTHIKNEELQDNSVKCNDAKRSCREDSFIFFFKGKRGTISTSRMRISKAGHRRAICCIFLNERKIDQMSPSYESNNNNKNVWRRGEVSCSVMRGQRKPVRLQILCCCAPPGLSDEAGSAHVSASLASLQTQHLLVGPGAVVNGPHGRHFTSPVGSSDNSIIIGGGGTIITQLFTDEEMKAQTGYMAGLRPPAWNVERALRNNVKINQDAHKMFLSSASWIGLVQLVWKRQKFPNCLIYLPRLSWTS